MNAIASSSNNVERKRIEDESGSSRIVQRKPIKIAVQSTILSVAFLADGRHFVSGDKGGVVRQWRVEDGEEVETPMDVESPVFSVVVSPDGKWIAAGTEDGRVIVWDSKRREEATEFTASKTGLNAVDISPDGTKFAAASDDENADVWSVADGTMLWGWQGGDFDIVKFSPDGSLFVTNYNDLGKEPSFGLQIVNSQDVKLLRKLPVAARSVVWASDSRRLFVLSADGKICCLDAYSQAPPTKWWVYSADCNPTHISLSSNGKFIAASANSLVSFWDTSSHQRLGYLQHPNSIRCMAISPNHDLVVAEGLTLTLRDLRSVLSASYIDDPKRPNTDFEKLEARLKETIPHPSAKLAVDQRTIKQQHGGLQKFIEPRRTELVDVRHVAYYRKGVQRLYDEGQVIDAAQVLLFITKSLSDDVEANTEIMNWLSGFAKKCIITLEGIGDGALETKKHDQALVAYAAALSLRPSSPHALLTKWAAARLFRVSIKETLDGANEFKLSKIDIRRAICDALERNGRVTEAIERFRQMQSKPAQQGSTGSKEQLQWELDFQRRCTERLEKLADIAVLSQSYNVADQLLSTMLSLDLLDRVDILIKRSKARVLMKSWEDALGDADEAIRLDPSSYLGYEQRYAALHGAKRHADAVTAFDALHSKLRESSDGRARALCSQYTDARPTIRRIIGATNSDMPPVLIDTITGQLLGSTERAKLFEALPIFNELVSSMTRGVDQSRILREVKEFYRYVMFSHKWEDDEPEFKQVLHVTVYKLDASRENMKLRTFCSLARSLGFRWAWSDTCCINREDNVVLQRSLVAMFVWYRGSSLTIVHLLGVSSLSEALNALRESIWNSRVWTYQEYVAAKRILFYTEDWKPYLGLTLSNHKESPTILREMEVSDIPTADVAILQPGVDRVREKLYLASTRETSLVEDIAYSLLGIFNASIPAIYGEGNRAVGRLLEHVLAASGDASILAWTGIANEYNSCLPLDLTVYNPLVPPHIPHMEKAKLDQMVAKLRSSLPNVSPATTLYDRLNGLPSATIVSTRLRLPCIVFRVTDLIPSLLDANKNLRVYYVTTMLGDIEIRTSADLNMKNEYYLIHPWIRPLLDQEYSRGTAGLDKTTCALRLLVRLRQRFGALLFEKVSRVEYKRVAADSLIMVEIRDRVPLTDLVDNIEIIEVQ